MPIKTKSIKDSAVTAAKLADGAIEATDIADNAVTTSKIVDGALAASTAGRAKIATDFFNSATAQDKFATDAFDASFCSSTIVSGAIPPSKVGFSTGSGITTQFPKVATIDSTTVKALLDSSANTLAVQLPAGSYLYDFVIWTQTAAGSAGTVKVGTDANWNDASNDDALVAAHNLNTPGTYKMSVVDAGSATSAVAGIFSSGTADLTIQSSADLSASSWVGGITIFYI